MLKLPSLREDFSFHLSWDPQFSDLGSTEPTCKFFPLQGILVFGFWSILFRSLSHYTNNSMRTGNLTFSLYFHLRAKSLFNKAKIKKRSKIFSPNEALLLFLCYNCYPDAPLKLQRHLFFPTWTSLSWFLCLYFQTHSDSEENNKKESIGKN